MVSICYAASGVSMSNKCLLDTSFLIAWYDETDPAHDRVQLVMSQLEVEKRFLLPQVVLTEALYMIKRDHSTRGAIDFQTRLIALQIPLQDVTYDDVALARDIMRRYEIVRFDFVDCCLMALAQRLALTQIGTLDQRDFMVYRPPHEPHFDLLP